MTGPGYFGLAVKDYTHSTAPHRRCPDLITQRLLKAAIAGRAAPYSYDAVAVLPRHFTDEEDVANKVERQVLGFVQEYRASNDVENCVRR